MVSSFTSFDAVDSPLMSVALPGRELEGRRSPSGFFGVASSQTSLGRFVMLLLPSPTSSRVLGIPSPRAGAWILIWDDGLGFNLALGTGLSLELELELDATFRPGLSFLLTVSPPPLTGGLKLPDESLAMAASFSILLLDDVTLKGVSSSMFWFPWSSSSAKSTVENNIKF